MAGEVAPWNLLQIAFIVVYPAWMSFSRMPNGMSLLAAYIYLFILAVPAVFIQLKLGNHQQKGIVQLLSTHIPLLKGVGITLLIQLFLYCVYMVPMLTHYGMYAFIAISKKPYVWSSCANVWNKDPCIGIDSNIPLGPSYSVQTDNYKVISAEAQFFDHEYIQLSDNISDIRGFAVWNFSDKIKSSGIAVLPLAMVAIWVFIFLTLAFGARVCGWILFLLGPGFLGLMFTVLGYGYSKLDANGTSTFLDELYTLDMSQFERLQDRSSPLIADWLKGFNLVILAIPVWTAILPTMGKMTGNGRLSRNISWIFVILVYAATCQIPQLSMAPYIGNLQQAVTTYQYNTKSLDLIFTTMTAAFSWLDIPPVYALLFYLSVFLGGLMFMIVAMFTILDNLVDSLVGFNERLQQRRACINFCAGFALISISIGASLLLTTQAGLYYIILMDLSTTKLNFLVVALYGICLIIVFVKMNFGIAERIIMSVWCGVSTLITTALLLYLFIETLDDVPSYHYGKIQGLQDLFCWIVAGSPFLAIPAAMIHSCGQEDGSCLKKMKYVFCGIKQDVYDPPQEYGYHHPDPSAPPQHYGNGEDVNSQHTYMYTDDPDQHHMYPMDDIHNHHYYKTTD